MRSRAGSRIRGRPQGLPRRAAERIKLGILVGRSLGVDDRPLVRASVHAFDQATDEVVFVHAAQGLTEATPSEVTVTDDMRPLYRQVPFQSPSSSIFNVGRSTQPAERASA
jgi:hypothetical protein